MKLFSLMALLATPAWAFNLDLPPRAQVVDRSSSAVEDYRVPLSALQDSGRDIRVDRVEVLSGTRERLTLKMPRDSDVDSVFTQLKQAQPAFECEARACGRSNLWANNLYGIRQLYGRDRFQRYQAVAIPGGWQTLYVIERGNQEIYAHLERVVDAQASVGVALALSVDPKSPGLLDQPALRARVQAQPELDWVVQVETGGDQPVGELNRRAEALSARLSQLLQGLPIRVRNLGATGREAVTLTGFQP